MSGNLTSNFQYEAGNALPYTNPNSMTMNAARINIDSMSAGGKKKKRRRTAKKSAARKSKKTKKTAKRKTSKNKKARKH
jgi:hypothetical protein